MKKKILFLLSVLPILVFIFLPHVGSQEINPLSIEQSVAQLEKEVADLERQTIAKRKQQGTNKTIEILEMKDMDILDAFKLIEAKSGVHIMTDEVLEGRVNVSLKDVDAFDALRIILEPKGLAYEKISAFTASVMKEEIFQLRNKNSFKGHLQTKEVILKYARAEDIKEALYRVKSASAKIVVNPEKNSVFLIEEPSLLSWLEEFIEKIDVPVETKIFILRHKDAEEMKRSLQAFLTEYVGRIHKEERNTIKITDTSEKLKYFETLINESDVEEKKIVFEVRVSQILLNEEQQAGIDWKAILSRYESMDYKNFWQDDTLSVIKWGIISGEDYPVLMEALEAVGSSRFIVDKQQEILKDEKFPILIHPQRDINLSEKEESSLASSTGFQIVLSYLKVEDSEIVVSFQPHINKLSEFPEVKIPQNSTLVIGGFFVDTNVASIRKIPFLSNIPFLGSTFQSQRKENRKSEVIIFITPKLVKMNKD